MKISLINKQIARESARDYMKTEVKTSLSLTLPVLHNTNKIRGVN